MAAHTRHATKDPVDRQEQALLSIVPRDSNTGFDMRAVLKMIRPQQRI